jgi:hypothetical protein
LAALSLDNRELLQNGLRVAGLPQGKSYGLDVGRQDCRSMICMCSLITALVRNGK